MQAEKIKTILASLVILAAVAFIYFSMTPRPPSVESNPHEALGQAVAKEAVNLLGSGGRVTLVVRDTRVFPNPATDYQVAAFRETLRKAKVSIAATNLIKLDPLRLPRVAPGDFLEIIKRTQEGDVIASFLGPPVISAKEKAQLGDKRPRIVAVCTGPMPRQINLQELFAQNLLHAAVISLPSPDPALPKTENLQIWFDHFFQLVTPANLNDLPVPEGPTN
jgi:hypothetical protein